jgi:hypothetical protein
MPNSSQYTSGSSVPPYTTNLGQPWKSDKQYINGPLPQIGEPDNTRTDNVVHNLVPLKNNCVRPKHMAFESFDNMAARFLQLGKVQAIILLTENGIPTPKANREMLNL